MTLERLAEIEAREKAATAGPWYFLPDSHDKWPSGENNLVSDTPKREYIIASYGYDADGINCAPHNADFITHSRADVPDLCRALRESWARIDTLEKSSCK